MASTKPAESASNGSKDESMIRILFMGRKRVAAKCLQSLVDDPRFSVVGVLCDHHLDTSPTSEVARASGLPLLDFETALAAIESRRVEYDLGLSMLYWRRLKGAFLGHPRFGTINFHPAPLPEYKGVGGYNLAILERLDRWAVSAHFIDEGIDTGPIIRKDWFPIDPVRETAQSLERESQSRLESLFRAVMDLVAQSPGDIPTTPSGAGTHLSRAELEAMKAVDLEHDDLDVKTRAFWFPPYDGAYLEVNGQKFTLVNRQILESLADPESSSLFSRPAGQGEC
jgi:methionyl-tRNA formyltransferase